MPKIFSESHPRVVSAMLIVALLSGCAGDDPPPLDGHLDCTTDETWIEQGSVLPDTEGLPTPREALEEALSRFEGRGGEVIMVTDRDGSLVVDGDEVVVAHATETPAGGWIVLTITGCGPYEG